MGEPLSQVTASIASGPRTVLPVVNKTNRRAKHQKNQRHSDSANPKAKAGSPAETGIPQPLALVNAPAGQRRAPAYPTPVENREPYVETGGRR
jgi:hypothetical protein